VKHDEINGDDDYAASTGEAAMEAGTAAPELPATTPGARSHIRSVPRAPTDDSHPTCTGALSCALY